MTLNVEEINHLTPPEIQLIHDHVIAHTGGLKGNRPGMSVEAVIFRVHTKILYSNFRSLVEIGAFYAEAIAKGHVFNDGNKRTALVSMITFLGVNGLATDLDQTVLADKMVDLASSKIDHKAFSFWVERFTRPQA